MLLAEDSSERAPSSSSRNACFTRRWQSSKVPRTESERTLPPQQVSWRSWVGDTSPLGKSTATSTPGRWWKAAATAPPVSPEVATRMVSGRSAPWRRQPKQPARKRAPKSLKAAVGPWNSSSTESLPSGTSGTSGAGKSSASAASGASSRASGSPSMKGASSRPAMAGSPPAPSKSAGARCGQLRGTLRPPSGASPWSTAAPKLTVGAPPRELANKALVVIAPPSPDHPRPVRAQLHHPLIGRERMPCEGLAHRRQHLWRRRLERPGEHRGARPRDRAPERTGPHGAAAHVREAGNQRLALRLDHDVLQGCADHVEVVGVAPRDEPGEMRRLPHEIGQLDAAPENGARLRRGEEHVGMDDDGADTRGYRDALHPGVIDADGEHEPPVERGCDVVDVPSAARHRFACHGELQQLELPAGLSEQRIRGHDRTHCGGRRASEARAERNALVDLESEAELGLQGLLHGEQRPSRGVVLDSLRQLAGDSPYCGYRHAGGGGRGHGDAIPERLDGKSEDVEADRDVADRGGRERARTRAWRRAAHSCAPR